MQKFAGQMLTQRYSLYKHRVLAPICITVTVWIGWMRDKFGINAIARAELFLNYQKSHKLSPHMHYAGEVAHACGVRECFVNLVAVMFECFTSRSGRIGSVMATFLMLLLLGSLYKLLPLFNDDVSHFTAEVAHAHLWQINHCKCI